MLVSENDGAMLTRTDGGATSPTPFALTGSRIVVGSAADCDVVIPSPDVAPHHAVLQWSAGSGWRIADLQNKTGTFVNGARLTLPHLLHDGDTVSIGEGGATFAYAHVPVARMPPIATIAAIPEPVPLPEPAPPAAPPSERASLKRPGVVEPESDEPRLLSELAPMFSRSRRSWLKRDYVVAGVLTTIASLLLLLSIGLNPALFRGILAAYLVSICFYALYVIAGKRRSLWECVAAALFTFVVLASGAFDLIAFVFRDVLPGNVREDDVASIGTFVKYFFGAGLCEELTKALPVFFFLWAGNWFHGKWRDRIGIVGPLEGLIIGAASACGFTLHETMTQYVPKMIHDATKHLGETGGALYGLELEIPRILGEVSGHMAWAGYFGYAIGLAVIRPKERLQIVLGAWLIAAFLHAAWDTFGDYGSSLSILTIVPTIIGVGSFLLLISATMRARAIEAPTLSQMRET